MTASHHDNLWRVSSDEAVSAGPLERDLTVDLAVIGGGFSGSSAALQAARSGASVALLEARTIGHGGSGRNVGLANAGLWLKPDEILTELGEDAGRALIARLGAAPDMVYGIIEREEISCEATRNGTLHCAHAPSGMEDLLARFRQGNAHGAPLQLLDAEEAQERVGSASVHGALFDPRAGTVQPLSYCRGLARAAQRAGAQIFEDSPVTEIARDGDGWRVTCNSQTVQAGALLMATNAYHAPLSGAQPPAYTPVHFGQFATAPMPAEARARILARGEGCWDTALVMSSFRTDRAGRIILGAMGNLDGPGGGIHAGWARRKLRQLFPELADLPFEHSWCGRIAMTSDHIPKIVSLGPNALSCFGYSGRGIGPGTVFGTAAAEALLTGDLSGLPLAPVKAHDESLTALRGSYYEFGATLMHAAGAR
ncbi:NAD(P)/FAD-dependent oxidoreductase [Salipiger bermudensis]|uniref:NAD(P)/FAD-dependent oxidoreductase n=1 Tax=Salipiger bermudensis TaxID=344736 RepID=UPI001CD62F0A|nr:FAD-binding oxidoreductase [Salipiger bermudensis]MCA0961226.1 FAD-binding oxidoreductase [Salipiger bermudensis]